MRYISVGEVNLCTCDVKYCSCVNTTSLTKAEELFSTRSGAGDERGSEGTKRMGYKYEGDHLDQILLNRH